jgi:transitional endoplasmic reticulum ATPase
LLRAETCVNPRRGGLEGTVLEPLSLRLNRAQQKAFDGLAAGISMGQLVVLRGRVGSGKTTILQRIAETHLGTLLGPRQFVDALKSHRPEAIEESFLSALDEALSKNRLVIFDDLHLVGNICESCDYPRRQLLDAALTAVLDKASQDGRTLLFAVEDDTPAPLHHRAYSWKIKGFSPEDYRELCETYLPGAELDFEEIHRFAPKLNGHQLRNACFWLRGAELDTARFVEHLRQRHMISNVKIEEVEQVRWQDLKGVDDLIRALEAKIALPFENRELAAQLGLKPKRGVLLAGPPGTGKTTIGRALAHRLKSKFFLIDGTLVSGSNRFYDSVDKVFDAAQRNAPSIIFIDDSDVIFEDKGDHGFYRYLLTKLDGLESASNARVCVMMTAMDAGSLPPALLRSGRIELWLETKLPDEDARMAILEQKIQNLPAPFPSVDVALLANAGRGLTGADLKAVVEDAKLLWAHDSVTGVELRSLESYFLEAMDAVRANKRNYGRRKPPGMVEMGPYGFQLEEETI